MTKLLDTEEVLKGLSLQFRMTAYSAMDASNHLAVHSADPREARLLHEVAIKATELAEVARAIGDAHARD